MQRSHGNPIIVHDDMGSVATERVEFGETGEDSFDENWLQNLIHKHPNCLPISEIEPGFETPVSICIEFPTKHGPIDNILVSPSGDIILVEVKLWRNPEARRKVVAQALDYASCIFEMDFAAFEEAALKGKFGDNPKPKRLYDILEPAGATVEADLVDAINLNLRKGRILVLVAGDGFRTEVERLTESLQSHAGFHFTFALVELAVFKSPEFGGHLVHPRILAKTCMIERGVVQIEDNRASVRGPDKPAKLTAGKQPKTITSEQFMEAMGHRNPSLPAYLTSSRNWAAAVPTRSTFAR